MESNLKETIKSIRENDWIIPEGINNYELTLEMLRNIGSTDSELRDDLILTLLIKIIIENRISKDEIMKLLDICLGKDYLFYNIGQPSDDSVFKRTFTLLAIEAIIYNNNQCEKQFIKDEKVLDVYRKILRYTNLERDVRGYVNIKGWAHSSAHTSDVLCVLAESKAIGHEELIKILEVVREKVFIDYYTYINQEDERLARTVTCVLDRKIISDEEMINWIKSFYIKDKKYTNEEEHLRENIKIFLRSLYFRFKNLNYDKNFISNIEKQIDMLPAYF